MWWDLGKAQIKTITQNYSSKIAKEKRSSFFARINSYIQELQSAPNITPETQQILEQQRNELNILLKNQAEGALVRSRVQHFNEVDTSSSYFFNLEKHHSQSKTLSCIRLPDGTVTENPEEIRKHCRNFYKQLYSHVPTDEGALGSLLYNLTKLDPRDAEDLDAPLRLEELDFAVKQLGKNKTPGFDGLTSEFYTFFWPLLKITSSTF